MQGQLQLPPLCPNRLEKSKSIVWHDSSFPSPLRLSLNWRKPYQSGKKAKAAVFTVSQTLIPNNDGSLKRRRTWSDGAKTSDPREAQHPHYQRVALRQQRPSSREHHRLYFPSPSPFLFPFSLRMCDVCLFAQRGWKLNYSDIFSLLIFVVLGLPKWKTVPSETTDRVSYLLTGLFSCIFLAIKGRRKCFSFLV